MGSQMWPVRIKGKQYIKKTITNDGFFGLQIILDLDSHLCPRWSNRSDLPSPPNSKDIAHKPHLEPGLSALYCSSSSHKGFLSCPIRSHTSRGQVQSLWFLVIPPVSSKVRGTQWMFHKYPQTDWGGKAQSPCRGANAHGVSRFCLCCGEAPAPVLTALTLCL